MRQTFSTSLSNTGTPHRNESSASIINPFGVSHHSPTIMNGNRSQVNSQIVTFAFHSRRGVA